MSTFEFLVVALLAVFVIVNVYLGITGRILNKKQTEIENDREIHKANWDKQVNALSLKCYEFQSENLKLNNEIKEWVKNYNKLTFAYNESQAELERYRNGEANKRRKPPKEKPVEETPVEAKPETENEQ